MAKSYCGFFDSTPENVRQYTEADMARYTRTMVASGVCDAHSLAVASADDGLKLTVGCGSAVVSGHYFALEDDGGGPMTFTLQAAGSKPRIDRIVLRLDGADDVRSVALAVLEGTETDTPAPPPLTRTGTIYEIALAQVRLAAGSGSLAPDAIIDERADDALCGILRPLSAAAVRALLAPIDALAHAASEQLGGAYFWANGPVALAVGTDGWTYDADNDRYYQDFAVPGMTAALTPLVTSTRAGGAFPLCGCASQTDAIRLFMTDTPAVTDTVTVYAFGLRADA